MSAQSHTIASSTFLYSCTRMLRKFAIRTMRHQFELIRVLATRYSLKRAMEVYPPEYKELLVEMLHVPTTARGPAIIEAIVDKLQQRGRAAPRSCCPPPRPRSSTAVRPRCCS